MKNSQLASIELLNGVSNVDGKRWVSASVSEAGVSIAERSGCQRRWKKAVVGEGGGCQRGWKEVRRASVGLTAISRA